MPLQMLANGKRGCSAFAGGEDALATGLKIDARYDEALRISLDDIFD